MNRRALVLVACAAAASTVLPAQEPAPRTVWLAAADQADRVRRVEGALPAIDIGPPVLNEAGYSLLWGGRTAQAVAVFEANRDLYPADANVYDSLAEGQMAAGLKDASIANYRKSLELDPRNENGRRMLERLGARPTPPNASPNKPPSRP